MTETVRMWIKPRRWWRWSGLAGCLVVYLGLLFGAPFRLFYDLDFKGGDK